MHDDETSPPQWYSVLIEWIKSSGGHINKSLVLINDDGVRGIGCCDAISEDELLIRLPPSLALNSESMPSNYNNSQHASPWLRCLATLYQATHSKDCSWRPYLDSLPDYYEHLFQWPNEHVDEYLKGTTLGAMVKQDRSEQTLKKQFATAIRPYLVHTGVLDTLTPIQDADQQQQQQQEEFRRLCMCISTRGFHLQSTFPSSNNTTARRLQDECYSGPFLLPFIDLLNHNPAQACTTLKRDDDTGHFYMIAERNIRQGEQIFHSYGHDLSSSQVLQTFGFVPDECIHRALTWNTATGMTHVDGPHSVTPATLSRDDILKACCGMKNEGYPMQVATHIAEHCPHEETWTVLSMMESRDIDLVPNTLVVSYSDAPLSDELVTLCTLLLLPDETFHEFMSESPALLDMNVLEDYFLGKLVCRSVLHAIDNKKREYGNDIVVATSKLRSLCENAGESVKSLADRHAMYGLTICIEEMACLEKLRKQVLELMDSLDDDKEGCKETDE